MKGKKMVSREPPRKYMSMVLLTANATDGQGHQFTRECLEALVVDFAAGDRSIPVLTSFQNDAKTMGIVEDLFMSGNDLVAKFSFLETAEAEAALQLLNMRHLKKNLELAAGGHIIEASVVVPEVDTLGNAGVQELFPPQRIERMKLTDTALVLDKVK